MQRDKIYFGIGLFIGIVASSFFFLFYSPRYSILEEGNRLIKYDRWTGKSWKNLSGTWEEIQDVDESQQVIDSEIRKALQVIIDQSNLDEALAKFKEAFPKLKDIPDDELFSRISSLYSKQLMSATFLQNYHIMLKERAQNRK